MAATIGDRLRELRKAKGISGHKMAELLGITPPSYYRYEKDAQTISSDVLERLAKILDCSSDYLLGLTDSPNAHYRDNDVNIKEFLNEGHIKFHWDGIPLGEKELKAAKEVLEYVLWKKIRGQSE